eukprot:gene2928-biopygen12647
MAFVARAWCGLCLCHMRTWHAPVPATVFASSSCVPSLWNCDPMRSLDVAEENTRKLPGRNCLRILLARNPVAAHPLQLRPPPTSKLAVSYSTRALTCRTRSPGVTGQARAMPAPRPRHTSQKWSITHATPASCPRHARATPAPVFCDPGRGALYKVPPGE